MAFYISPYTATNPTSLTSLARYTYHSSVRARSPLTPLVPQPPHALITVQALQLAQVVVPHLQVVLPLNLSMMSFREMAPTTTSNTLPTTIVPTLIQSSDLTLTNIVRHCRTSTHQLTLIKKASPRACRFDKSKMKRNRQNQFDTPPRTMSTLDCSFHV